MNGLNRVQIKYLAIVCMLIDHIAWAFFPASTVTAQIMHFLGRLTGPVMAYFLADSFRYTSNKRRYGIRLGIFALISWIPFSLFESGELFSLNFGVIFTLFLAFLALYLTYETTYSNGIKITGIILLCLLSLFGDWPVFDVLIPLYVYGYGEDVERKQKFFVRSSLLCSIIFMFTSVPVTEGFFHLGMIMVPLLIKYGYNGKAGSKAAFHKWFFYVFYPLHLLILFWLKRVLL